MFDISDLKPVSHGIHAHTHTTTTTQRAVNETNEQINCESAT